MEILRQLKHYDHQLFAMVFNQKQRSAVIALARLFSRSGEGVLHLLIPLAVWYLQLPGLQNLVALIAVAFALECCLHWLLKNSLRRPRPHRAIQELHSLVIASSQFSFPSGHSSHAFLLATVLVIEYGSPMLGVFLWASAVAVSRVVLGVHYPGDTLGGAIVGSSTALLSAALLGLI